MRLKIDRGKVGIRRPGWAIGVGYDNGGDGACCFLSAGKGGGAVGF